MQGIERASGKERLMIESSNCEEPKPTKTKKNTNRSKTQIKTGRWPRPPYIRVNGLTPRRYILGSLPTLIMKLKWSPLETIEYENFNVRIIGIVFVHKRNYTPPKSMPTSKQDTH